jgi:hypothetical protein
MKITSNRHTLNPEVTHGVAFDYETDEFVVTKKWMIERNPLGTVTHQGRDYHGSDRSGNKQFRTVKTWFVSANGTREYTKSIMLK